MGVWKPPKSRFWHYDFQFKGRRFHGSTGVETRRKAEAVERKRREEAALGVAPDGGMTLDQAAGRWWLEVGQYRAEAQHVDRRIQILLRLVGGNAPIASLTTRHFSAAIEKRRGETFVRGRDRPAQNGKPAFKAKRYPVSNATVNADIIDTARPILLRAQKSWEVPGLKPIDWKRLRLPEPAPQVRVYSAEQQAAWLGECDETAREALRLSLKYGLRFNELFFPPEAFDGDGPRLVLNRRKKDVPHVVPLTVGDGRKLAARVGRAKAAKLETIWFEANGKGDLEPLTYLGLQSRLRSAAKRAGLTMGRVIHGARHHAGTTLLRETGNLKLTQQLLGHKDIKSTMRYAHALEADLRAALSEGRTDASDAIEAFTPARKRRSRTGER